MKQPITYLILALLAVVLLAGCRQAEPTATPAPTSPAQGTAAPDNSTASQPPSAQPGETAYPAPETQPLPEAGYPMATEEVSAYPGPQDTPAPIKSGPPFYIDEPVLAGSTELTGRGPAGVPIRVVDVTTLGTELGSGVIREDGTFAIQLGVSLEAGHSVGLKIGNLDGTSFAYEDFMYGETYYDRPYVGILLAMASVVEQ